MSMLDEYIAKCDEAASDGFPQNERNALAREIISAFHNTIPNIRHYRGARITGDGSSERSHQRGHQTTQGESFLRYATSSSENSMRSLDARLLAAISKKCEHLIEDSDTTDEAANELGFEISSI